MEQGSKKAAFSAPLDGVISSINEEVVENPVILRKNPYKKGWIYSIKPTNMARDIKSLAISGEPVTWLKNKVRRFKDFINQQSDRDKQLGMTLGDRGIPVDGVMEYMDGLSWKKFQREFLEK